MADVYNHKLAQVNRQTFNITSNGINEYKLRLQAPVLGADGMKHAGSIVVVSYLGSGYSDASLTCNTSVNEGTALPVTVSITNILPTTELSWRINIVSGLTTEDFTASSGSVSNRTSTSASFSVTVLRQKLTSTVAKKFTISLLKGGEVLATTPQITVNNISQSPGYSITLQSTANEGDIVPVTVTEVPSSGDNPEASEILTWFIQSNGGYSAIENYSPVTGTVNMINGSGSFDLRVIADKKTNPTTKSFNIKLAKLFSSITQINNPTCTISDTSRESWAGGNANGLQQIPSTISRIRTSASVPAAASIGFYPYGNWIISTGFDNVIEGYWWSNPGNGTGNNYRIKIDYTQVARTPYGTSIFVSGGTSGTVQQLNETRLITLQADSYACTDPSTPILLTREGLTKLAGELVAGDSIYTMHEATRDWGYYTITHAEIVTQPKALVTFDDGSTIHASLSHKFYLGKNIWKNIFNLVVGDQIATSTSGFKRTIVSIEETGQGDVVSLEVENAHTYIANGLISHNHKRAVDYSGNYLTRISYNFTVTIYGPPSYNVSLGSKSFTVTCEVGEYLSYLDNSLYNAGDGGDSGDSGDS